MSDRDLEQLKDDLARAIGEFRIRGVIVDVTSMDVLDSFATRTIQNIAFTARVRGAKAVIVGIQPEVAIAMVELGLTLEGVATELDLDDGLLHLNRCETAQEGSCKTR